MRSSSGHPGTGKSHLVQAIGYAVIQQGYRVAYREAHTPLDELTDATLAGTRKEYFADLATVPLLIIDLASCPLLRTHRYPATVRASGGKGRTVMRRTGGSSL